VLDDSGLFVDCIVERQWAIEDPPVICPRSAILHSAAASIVDGRRD